MEEYYLMWLSRTKGITFRQVNRLLEQFGSAEAVWNAEPKEILELQRISDKLKEQLLKRNADTLDEWIVELEEKQIDFYSYWHPCYPALLKEIHDPPLGIYVKGELPEEGIDTVAIIGARNCSEYGRTVAYEIARDLGKTNIIVISGMARGIDSQAHKGIMDGGGRTIAVLGCGVDICYPKENAQLMERIIENGCVLSEYPPGTRVNSYHFPARNRIIAGLSKMVVVVEAGKKSGTFITADLALENGREVFVVPGNVTSPFSEGTNALIKQGCPIITEWKDILEELGILYDEREKVVFSIQKFEQTSPEEKEVLELIAKDKPITAEILCRTLHKDIQEIQYILSLLELSGYIRHVPQAGYTRVSE